MQIEGATVLVTGANRGIGRELAAALVERGAAKVYAGVRDPASVTDDRLHPVALDITDAAQVRAAAAALTDVTIVINNAGISTGTNALTDDDLAGARRELEVNFFGPLAVSQAFAPVLRANGGGALVNVLSALSWVAFPAAGNYASAKAAAWSMTNSLRVMLRGQATLVVGAHFGYVDTDMTAGVTEPKSDPKDIASRIVDAIAAGEEEVHADAVAAAVKGALSHDQEHLYPGVQQQYDAALAAA